MKKLCVLLGILFILPLVALPAKAASADAGRKALCNWAKEHNLQASMAVSGACGEVGVELIANANVGGQSSQQAQLVAEANRLRAIADEKHAAYSAAINARKTAYQNLIDFCSSNGHGYYSGTCGVVPGYEEMYQAYDDAQRAEEAAMDEFYDADDAAEDAEIEAGLREPNPCIANPSLPQCNVK